MAVIGLNSGVTAVAAGYAHSLAVRNGGVYAWGSNIDGELGDGTTTERDSPVALTGLGSGVTAIAAGDSHSLAVRNGALYAWGDGFFGQLGDGTTSSRHSPVAVGGLINGVTAIAAGNYHSLAVQNGNVFAWGDNGWGQLGDGTVLTERNVPEQIDPADLNNIVAVAAGHESSYALSFDGSLWVWGDNRDGELGIGSDTPQYLTPQHLLPPAGYKFTSIDADADSFHVVATLAAVPVPEPTTLVLVALAH